MHSPHWVQLQVSIAYWLPSLITEFSGQIRRQLSQLIHVLLISSFSNIIISYQRIKIMGVKVFYKSPVMWNMILFCIFSVMFLYFQSIYRFDSSILSRDFYLRYINDNWSIIMVSSLTMISLFYDFKRLASFLFALMVSITLAITTYFLFLDFCCFHT